MVPGSPMLTGSWTSLVVLALCHLRVEVISRELILVRASALEVRVARHRQERPARMCSNRSVLILVTSLVVLVVCHLLVVVASLRLVQFRDHWSQKGIVPQCPRPLLRVWECRMKGCR